MRHNKFLYLPLLALPALLAAPVLAAAEVVVYSARKEQLIEPLFKAFTEQTGIEVNYITDSEGPLLARLKAEGANTPADMLMTVDAGNLWQAANEGVLSPVDSQVLEENIPDHLQDPENRWFGLSIRARTIFYAPSRVNPEELSTYEALGDPKWKGRLCLRTSKKVYNQSLVAMMIAREGEEKTQEVVESWVDNLATEPFSSDTTMLEAIAAGQCDVGIANTYYFGRLQKDNPDIDLAPFWPDQEGHGVHVNVSGAGVTEHAKNREQAVQLLEWLSTPAAQEMFAGLNMEYPANPEVAADPLVESWGEFKQDTINVSEAGRLQPESVMLMDRAGYR